MKIQSVSTPAIPVRSAAAAKTESAPALPGDSVSLSNLQSDGPNGPHNSNNSKLALQMVGIGVMFGGILAATNLPSGWVGPAIIGSMCGGLAIMMAAR